MESLFVGSLRSDKKKRLLDKMLIAELDVFVLSSAVIL